MKKTDGTQSRNCTNVDDIKKNAFAASNQQLYPSSARLKNESDRQVPETRPQSERKKAAMLTIARNATTAHQDGRAVAIELLNYSAGIQIPQAQRSASRIEVSVRN